jgi:predicted HTH transcriptional regulator
MVEKIHNKTIFKDGNMDEFEQEVLDLLRDIRELLVPIGQNARQQFLKDKRQLVRDVLTENNKRIFPLLVDSRRLTQDRIAKEAGVSQATVSRFISELKKRNLIVEEKDSNLNTRFIDHWQILNLIEGDDDDQ